MIVVSCTWSRSTWWGLQHEMRLYWSQRGKIFFRWSLVVFQHGSVLFGSGSLCLIRPSFDSTRTSPWLCTWGTTGRTSACRSPAAPTRAWRSMAAWWRRSGSLMSSLCTLRGPSSTTPPQTTSCCASFLMDTFSTAWGLLLLWSCFMQVSICLPVSLLWTF